MVGILRNRENLMFYLIFMEMIVLNLTVLFTWVSHLEGSAWGQAYSLYIMTVGAVESAILVTLVVQFFRYTNTISLGAVNASKLPLYQRAGNRLFTNEEAERRKIAETRRQHYQHPSWTRD